MSLEQQVADLVSATNQLTGMVAGKQQAIDATVTAKKAELDIWRQGARSEMALPFSTTISVAGDANSYYPIPIRFSPSNRLGRLVISRRFDAPHPAVLGADHVAGLLLELRIREDGWSDFSHTRVDYFGYSYHQSVARVRADLLGRVVWLRGGGMEYRFCADFDLIPGYMVNGTENLKPILVADTPLYPEVPTAPYSGGQFKVSPLAAVDAMWANPILSPTFI